jgi:hypothetical protein
MLHWKYKHRNAGSIRFQVKPVFLIDEFLKLRGRRLLVEFHIGQDLAPAVEIRVMQDRKARMKVGHVLDFGR